MSSSSEGVVHSSGFNLLVILSSDNRDKGTYCIVATKDKTMGLISLLGFLLSTLCHLAYCVNLFLANLIL